MPRMIHALLLAVVIAGVLPARASAQETPPDLAQATLEELMAIRVTSAARKSQRVEDVPAAVYVITRQAIRQSGLATIPELLRLAPGVQVAQINANKWAISIRGFNSLYSNKLLVLVDGRSVYTRTFSGVFWDTQDLMVADIDRIEIIRGPGGAVWGANAVNGVINIITLPAADTKGLSLAASLGTFERGRAGIRYGGTMGRAAYRAFSQWSGYADAEQPEHTLFADRWQALTNGFRLDWSRGADTLMTEGHVSMNRTRPGWLALTSIQPDAPPSTDGISHATEASVLGRWTHTRTDGTVLQVQAYHTRAHREEAILELTERTSDVDVQYERRLGSRHGLVVGGGHRHVDLSTVDTLTVQLGALPTQTFNTFIQDEIAAGRALAVTLGAKLEHDTFGGWGLLPSARVIWEATARQHVWTAVSRTRRTPSVTDRAVRINLEAIPGSGLPILIGVVGNRDFRSEQLVQTEAGYRVRIGRAASLEATAFRGQYDGLTTVEPFDPVVELTPAPAHLFAGAAFANLLDVRTRGIEVNAQWSPLAAWQLEGSYSLLQLTARPDPASRDTTAGEADGHAPEHQWQARSTYALTPDIQVMASVARVGRLERVAVPAHTRLDTRAEFSVNRHLTVAVVAQNLLKGTHQEFSSDSVFLSSRIPRSARLDLRWSY